MNPAAEYLLVANSIKVPEKVRFLNDRQKRIAIARVSLEKAGQQTRPLTFTESLKMLGNWKIVVL